MDNTFITTGELAKLLDLTTARIRQLVDEGVIERAGRGRFNLLASANAYINFIRAKAEEPTGAAGDYREQKTRLAKAQAEAAELSTAVKRGELAPIAEFEKAAEARMHAIRVNMLNVPQRATIQLLGETSETRFKNVLRSEIVQALTDSANAEIDWDDE